MDSERRGGGGSQVLIEGTRRIIRGGGWGLFEGEDSEEGAIGGEERGL
jgi:hypothetical protein